MKKRKTSPVIIFFRNVSFFFLLPIFFCLPACAQQTSGLLSNSILEGTYFMFFSTWTSGYEIGLLKSKSPLGTWELVSREPIFGTRKKGYRPELAAGGGYAHLQFQDTEDPYCETGHNALFEGLDGQLWSSCHYTMYEKRPYPYSQTLEAWEKTPQMGYEPVYYKDGRFFIKGPTWTEQKVE